jgi:hypothetical protein
MARYGLSKPFWTGDAVNKVCSGSEMPLRVFWLKIGARFHTSPSNYKIRFIGVPNGSPDFRRD